MDYNSSNLQSYISGLSASDTATFAGDLAANWLGAWTARFTITTRLQNSLNNIPAYKQQHFIDDLNALSAAKSANLTTIDYSGMLVDDSNPLGPSIANKGSLTIHTNWQWVGVVFCMTSLWIEHKAKN